jgi:hypothetical protein
MAVAIDVLRPHLLEFLRGGSAHVDAETVFADFPLELAGVRPAGSPHSPWELLEHLRLTLADLVRFCTDPAYKAPQWPEEYWPSESKPQSAEAWAAAAADFQDQLRKFEQLVEDPQTDLAARIPWGDGQTILREVLLAGDHTSYHLGQMVLMRKQLGAWKAA